MKEYTVVNILDMIGSDRRGELKCNSLRFFLSDQ